MRIKDGVLTSVDEKRDIKRGKFIIPDSTTEIGNYAFYNCSGLTNIEIPDSVTTIGSYAFWNCSGLISIEIPDSVTSIGESAFYNCRRLIKTDKKYYYKAFRANLTCRDFKYKENEWFEQEGKIKLCENGFHACKNAYDVFNYYDGKLNRDIVVYKVELDGISDEKDFDSKVVARRIRLVEKVNSYAELSN